MLTQSSVSIGTNLAEIVTDAGIKLVPKHSTLLQELVSSTTSNIDGKIYKREYIEPIISEAARGRDIFVKNTKSYSESSHDTLMDNYQVDLAAILSNHITFARNVVNKEVSSLKEKITKNLSEFNFKEAEDFFNIKYFKMSDVFNSFIIENEINSYNDSRTKFYYEPIDVAKLSDTDFNLGTYILTGDEEQDSLITAWFNAIDAAMVNSYVLGDVSDFALPVNDLMDYSLVNYLFYRNLLNKADLNLGLSSIQLKSKASANRDYFGNKLSIALELYRKEINSGRILSSNSETAFSYFSNKCLNVTVYEETFAKLAEAGCSIEVLFGYISSENKNDITVAELVDKKEVYLSKWNSTRSLYLVSMNNNRVDIFKQILTSVFDESLTNLTEEEKEVFATTQQFANETKEKAYKYIDELQLSEIDNLDKITLDLVGKIRFRFSNAYFILNEMSEILKMSEDITPMEAALYSAIKYITDFLLEQCTAVNN